MACQGKTIKLFCFGKSILRAPDIPEKLKRASVVRRGLQDLAECLFRPGHVIALYRRNRPSQSSNGDRGY
jgi:hypothetical protein